MTKLNAIHGDFTSLPQVINSGCRNLAHAFRKALAAGTPATSLNAKLLHDIGESDCRPMPRTPQEKSKETAQRTFEAMKLRAF